MRAVRLKLLLLAYTGFTLRNTATLLLELYIHLFCEQSAITCVANNVSNSQIELTCPLLVNKLL